MGFKEAYASADSKGASDELRPLVQRLYEDLMAEPTRNLDRLKDSIISVLEFLASPYGRTDANCDTVNMFLMDVTDQWERPWPEDLPDDFQKVLGRMADTLHDTVSAPEIAQNFGSTPEQLLPMARALRREDRSS